MKKIMSLAILTFVFLTQPYMAGEPVPGADIYIEQGLDDEPIANTCKKIFIRNDCSVVCVSPKGANVPDGVYHGIFSSTNKIKKKIVIRNGKVIKGCQPGAKAKGNKGGFAIGGFSPA